MKSGKSSNHIFGYGKRASMASPYLTSQAQSGRFFIAPDAKLKAILPCGGTETFQVAGPFKEIFFEPKNAKVGILTAGGICPGINTVISELVSTHIKFYGTKQDNIMGFRHGFNGLKERKKGQLIYSPINLNFERIGTLDNTGGTILGTCRAEPDIDASVAALRRLGVDILYVIGGDGSQRAAHGLAVKAYDNKYPLSVIGIPKTIDNDIGCNNNSFGFRTAVEESAVFITRLHNEAKAFENSIFILTLMGRHSGKIAAHASAAKANLVDICLIPEVGPFPLIDKDPNAGPKGRGLLNYILNQLIEKPGIHKNNPTGHIFMCVAEGISEHLQKSEGFGSYGLNEIRKNRVGEFLAALIDKYLEDQGMRNYKVTSNHPEHLIRSMPPNTWDEAFCRRLATNAVHAAMAGYTDVLSGWSSGMNFLMPLEKVVDHTHTLNLTDPIWRQIVSSNKQPSWLSFPSEETTL